MRSFWSYDGGLLDFIFTLLAWGVIAFFIWRNYTYGEKEKRPRLWKIAIVVLIGLFSFTINLPLFDNILPLAILPLGAWILFWVLNSRGRWQTYRKYAWLGFFGNYIFLTFSLLAIAVTTLVYPSDKAETYFADLSNAELLTIHPSGGNASIDTDELEKSIPSFQKEQPQVVEWYNEIIEQKWSDEDNVEVQEKFPYMLIGVKPKNLEDVTVFVEEDGKGLLITTKTRQHYFHSETASFLTVKEDAE